MILGTSLGQFAGEMVAQSAKSAGIDFAPPLGKLVSGFIIFVFSMARTGGLAHMHYRPPLRVGYCTP